MAGCKAQMGDRPYIALRADHSAFATWKSDSIQACRCGAVLVKTGFDQGLVGQRSNALNEQSRCWNESRLCYAESQHGPVAQLVRASA